LMSVMARNGRPSARVPTWCTAGMPVIRTSPRNRWAGGESASDRDVRACRKRGLTRPSLRRGACLLTSHSEPRPIAQQPRIQKAV
jgi:hypothetical protein